MGTRQDNSARSALAGNTRGPRANGLSLDANDFRGCVYRCTGREARMQASDSRRIGATGDRISAPRTGGLYVHQAETQRHFGGSVWNLKMDPKLGTTLGYLGTSLLKAIETSDIELRLAKLER